MRTFFLFCFGLSPLWAAFGLIAFAFLTMGSEGGGMSLWALLPAIPACFVTILIANVGIAVHAWVPGEPKTKLLAASAFVITASLVVVFWAATYWQSKLSSQFR